MTVDNNNKTEPSVDVRAQLIALLSARGVLGAAKVANEFEDGELAGAFSIVAYFDRQRSKSPGLLVHLLREGDIPGAEPPEQVAENSTDRLIRRSHEGQRRAVAWALSQGFSQRQAPFAASVAGRMKSQKRREVRAAEVREQMLAQWPDLEKV